MITLLLESRAVQKPCGTCRLLSIHREGKTRVAAFCASAPSKKSKRKSKSQSIFPEPWIMPAADAGMSLLFKQAKRFAQRQAFVVTIDTDAGHGQSMGAVARMRGRSSFAAPLDPGGCASKLNHQKTPGCSPCFHLPGQPILGIPMFDLDLPRATHLGIPMFDLHLPRATHFGDSYV